MKWVQFTNRSNSTPVLFQVSRIVAVVPSREGGGSDIFDGSNDTPYRIAESFEEVKQKLLATSMPDVGNVWWD